MIYQTRMNSGVNRKANTGDADVMMNDFIHDMSILKNVRFLHPKWITNHRVWKCLKHAEQKGKIIELPKMTDVGNGEDAAWDQLINELNELKDQAPPAADAPQLAMSNKFAVDPIVCTINHYKSTIPANHQSSDDLVNVLGLVASFTTLTSVSNLAWTRFTHAHATYESFFRDLTVGNTLYDNPGKLTKQRLFACAALVTKALEPTAMFGNAETQTAIPKVICSIYKLDVEYDEISNDAFTMHSWCHFLLCI